MIISKEVSAAPPQMAVDEANWLWRQLTDHYRDIVSLSYNDTASVRTLDATDDLLDTDYTILLDGSSEAVSATLPDVSAVTGKVYIIKCIDASNTCSIDPGTDEIDGSSTDITLALNKSRIIQSNGSSWYILGGVV